jgi:hypothetical protein
MSSILRITLCIPAIGFLLVAAVTTVTANTEPNQSLGCLSCHQKTLEFHNQLGSGNKACWSCHDSSDMTSLRLTDGTRLSQAESSQLCGQCHQARYKAWQEGTHGFPGTIAIGKCTDCHDPHQPQMAFLDITKPHPAAAPPAPSVPLNLVMMVAISLVLVTVLTIIMVQQGREL